VSYLPGVALSGAASTQRGIHTRVTRRLLLGSIAATAVLGLNPRAAAASVGEAWAVEGPSGSIGLPEDSFADPASASLLDQPRDAVAFPIPWRSRVQIRSEQGLKRVSHPQLHWVEPPAGGLHVPWVSQYDGSAYSRSNCGCACLSMLMAYAGVLALPVAVRQDVNRFMHNSNVEAGASWESLAATAEKRGLVQHGLFSAPKRRRVWSSASLDAELNRESPVLVLVRFGLLPGRNPEVNLGDHYCVVAGRDRFGHYYLHDPANHDTSGAFVRLSRIQLQHAWSQTACGIRYSGMVVQPKG
jgi:Peptidase_C39 like family